MKLNKQKIHRYTRNEVAWEWIDLYIVRSKRTRQRNMRTQSINNELLHWKCLGSCKSSWRGNLWDWIEKQTHSTTHTQNTKYRTINKRAPADMLNATWNGGMHLKKKTWEKLRYSSENADVAHRQCVHVNYRNACVCSIKHMINP